MRFSGRLLSTVAVAAALTVGLVGGGLAQDATPAAPGALYPNHFHAGTCADYDPAPAISLADLQFPDWVPVLTGEADSSAEVTLPDPEAFGNAPIPVAVATTEVSVALADIVSGKHVINVHNPANPDETVVCGNVGGVPDDRGDLFVGLGESNGSGYSGAAWLHDNGGSTTVVVFLTHPAAQASVEAGLEAMVAAAAAEQAAAATPAAAAQATPEAGAAATPVT